MNEQAHFHVSILFNYKMCIVQPPLSELSLFKISIAFWEPRITRSCPLQTHESGIAKVHAATFVSTMKWQVGSLFTRYKERHYVELLHPVPPPLFFLVVVGVG